MAVSQNKPATTSTPLESPLTDPSDPSYALTTALLNLGYEPAARETYDWLYTYRNARPLLDALASSFTPSCVLSEPEADRYAALLKRSPHPLDEPHASAAALPLLTAPSVQPRSDAHKQLTAALQMRLTNLHAQVHALQEAERTSADVAAHSGDAAHDFSVSPRTPSPRHAADADGRETHPHVEDEADVSMALGTLRDHLDELENAVQFRTPRSSQRHDGMLSNHDTHAYCEQEMRECNSVAHTIELHVRQSGLQDGNVAAALSEEAPLTAIVASYAELQVRLCKADAELARYTGMMTSMTEDDDGRFVNNMVSDNGNDETTVTSMQSVATELSQRAARTMGTLLDEVRHRAAQNAWNRLYAQALTRSMERQTDYIDLLQECLINVVEQRLRVLCLQRSQEQRLLRQNDLFDSLLLLQQSDRHYGIKGECKSEKVCVGSAKQEDTISTNDVAKGTSVEAAYHGEDRAEGDDSADEQKIQMMTESDVDRTEEEMFTVALNDASSMLMEFRERIGCNHGQTWLDLQTNSKVRSQIKELGGEVTSNMKVLEALLRNRAHIQRGATPLRSTTSSASSSTPGKDWVARIHKLINSETTNKHS